MKSKISFLLKYLKNYKYNWKFKVVICLPIISFLLFVDWFSKALVEGTMSQGERKPFIKGLVNLEYKINPGAAYGMNSNSPTLAISIAAVVSILILIIFLFVREKYWLIGLTFMVAGSYGNLLARAWAPEESLTGVRGGVIDFLHWDFNFLGSNNYIFNFADVFVNISVVLIILAFVMYIIEEILRVYYKRNEELYKKYIDYKVTINDLYIIYWSNFYSKKNDNYISFLNYIKRKSELKTNWKLDKKEILNGTKSSA
ncbi:signal peptidase II [Spiroplasma turonicum]|uniref:Lipoprotein signal peptidase n=1 Tax=Spiroplasma turonicum TaxID=216946 RepID=A0A0K1P5D5_9MOLU|nr:signal peptidase II [Spiroplasma turonicum]AKU79495.1 lipoprotein signal peptidase [Spiroplasma turonicum]ALX70516.1 lipoprotein signal peptidase [Spiroplasma turonicum]